MSQSYFQSLVGETVHFINPQGRRNSCIVTVRGAFELFKLQEHGYKFLPRVTDVRTTECEACSA
jgi:hypothetical protein